MPPNPCYAARHMDRTFAITIAWFILLFTSTKVAAEIVIHEIHYNPAERGQALEFIELLNHGEKSINLSGWKFDQGISFTFPANTPPLAPGGLLVVAEDPAQVKEVYQTEAVGPWEGKLSNRGETLTLRNAQGKKVDEVAYGVGFPWPATAAGGGASMELIHPNLDNNLAGSWRSSIPSAPAPASKSLVAAASTSWRYFKGTQEPPPRWLTIDFDDAAWLQCQTPIGYADEDDHTVLGDMLGKYSTVYLRHVFQIPSDQSLDRPLALRIYSDDGALVWLNGIEVGRLRVADPQPNHRSQTTQNHEATWETITLEQPWRVLRPGKNVLAVLGVNGSTTSSDFSIDAELSEATESSMLAVPSPGTANRSALGMPPPQIRQVDHEPRQPRTGQSVVISAKVTDPDGLAKVTLLYQKLRPGHYIAKSDAGYETEWQERDMVPQESVFTAEILDRGSSIGIFCATAS